MGQKEGTSKYLYFSPRGSRLISENAQNSDSGKL